jgi:hypothetical protein
MRHVFAAALAGMTLFAAPPADAQTMGKVSHATDAKAYRKDGARHLYAIYAQHIYKGKLPPLVHAIVVVETELDAGGHVRDIRMIRVPTHAPDVTERVRGLIRQASPLPAPSRMGSTRYLEIWLVDKSGRFQLDTLTEGQL